jgi:hypothetical protein
MTTAVRDGASDGASRVHGSARPPALRTGVDPLSPASQTLGALLGKEPRTARRATAEWRHHGALRVAAEWVRLAVMQGKLRLARGCAARVPHAGQDLQSGEWMMIVVCAGRDFRMRYARTGDHRAIRSARNRT